MSQDCIYHERDDGIHHFEFTATTREAVDEWLTLLRRVIAAGSPLEYILMDFSSIDLPPVMYFIEQWHEHKTLHHALYQARIAVLYRQRSGVRTALRTLSTALVRQNADNVALFPDNDDAAAVAWLLNITNGV